MRSSACVRKTCSPQARFLTQAIAFRSPPSQREARVVMRDNRVQGRFSSVFCAFFPARGTAAQAHGCHAPAQTRPAPAQMFHAPVQMFHAPAQMFRAQAQETSARAQETHALGQIAAAQAQGFCARVQEPGVPPRGQTRCDAFRAPLAHTCRCTRYVWR